MKPRFTAWLMLTLAAASSLAPLRLANATMLTAEQEAEEQRKFADYQVMALLSQQPGANDAVTLHQLAGLTIQDVRWVNTTAQAALADLSAKVKSADPRHIGIKFTVSLTPSPNKANALPFNLATNNSLHVSMQNNVCIILKEPTTALALLYMIGEQTNLAFQVQRGTVTMKPWEPGAIPCQPAMFD